MRIAFVAPFGLKKKSTVWARTLPLAQHLVTRGHGVALLVPPWDSPEDSGRQSEEEGVKIVQVSLNGGPPAVMWRLIHELGRLRPDIVHIVKPRAYAGLVHWWLWQRRRVGLPLPALFLDIDDWEQAWAEVNGYPPMLSRFLAWQEEWGLRHAPAITAASQWLAERSRLYAPSAPVLYLPNGVVDPHSSNRAAGEDPGRRDRCSVLYFTRFVEIAPCWLAAFHEELIRLVPNATLLVAGDAIIADRARRFRTEVETAGLSHPDRIQWMGPVPRAEVPALYAAAGCAIFPADPVPLQEAKCSVRLATALLYGVPVVASTVGEQAQYGAQGAAVLVDPLDGPRAFAAAVASVFHEPARRRRLSSDARNRLLSRYSWTTLGDRLEAFYEEYS